MGNVVCAWWCSLLSNYFDHLLGIQEDDNDVSNDAHEADDESTDEDAKLATGEYLLDSA